MQGPQGPVPGQPRQTPQPGSAGSPPWAQAPAAPGETGAAAAMMPGRVHPLPGQPFLPLKAPFTVPAACTYLCCWLRCPGWPCAGAQKRHSIPHRQLRRPWCTACTAGRGRACTGPPRRRPCAAGAWRSAEFAARRFARPGGAARAGSRCGPQARFGAGCCAGAASNGGRRGARGGAGGYSPSCRPTGRPAWRCCAADGPEQRPSAPTAGAERSSTLALLLKHR